MSDGGLRADLGNCLITEAHGTQTNVPGAPAGGAAHDTLRFKH